MKRPALALVFLSLLASTCGVGGCADARGDGTRTDATDARLDTLTASDSTIDDSQTADDLRFDTAAGDTGSDLPSDTAHDGATVDTADSEPDTAPEVPTDTAPDALGDTADAVDTTPVVCDQEGFAVAAQAASGEAGFLDFTAASVASVPYDAVNIELLYEAAPALPYQFALNGENYKTCEACVTIRTQQGCEGASCAPKLFLAYAGELEVTQWDVPGPGARFAGTLRGIEAHEVTLAGGLHLDPGPGW